MINSQALVIYDDVFNPERRYDLYTQVYNAKYELIDTLLKIQTGYGFFDFGLEYVAWEKGQVDVSLWEDILLGRMGHNSFSLVLGEKQINKFLKRLREDEK